MNEEKKIQWFMLGKLFAIVTCVSLYAFGGIEHKWLRRFVALGVCVSTMYLYTKDLRVFIQLPFMFVGLGYGAEETWLKIVKRAYVGLYRAMFTGGYYIYLAIKGIRNMWFLVAGYGVIVIVGFIIFGVWNPFDSARIEESVLALLIYGIPILAARDKKLWRYN